MSINKDNNNNTKDQTEEEAIIETFTRVARSKFLKWDNDPSSLSKAKEAKNADDKKYLQALYYDFLGQITSSKRRHTQSDVYNAEKDFFKGLFWYGEKTGLLASLAIIGTYFFFDKGLPIIFRGRSAYQVNDTVNNNMKGGYTAFGTPKKEIINTRGLRILSTSISVIFVVTYGYFQSLALMLCLNDYEQDASSVPLLPGRSIVSDELCTDFIDVYRSIPKSTIERVSAESKSVQAIGDFVKNCLRRELMEKMVLMEEEACKDLIHQYRANPKRFQEQTHVKVIQDFLTDCLPREEALLEEQDSGSGDTTGNTKKHPAIPGSGIKPDIPVIIEWRDAIEMVTTPEDKIDDDSFHKFD